MTLNFCLPHFSPRIQCNKVCADGFEVSNLISADPVKRKCGFRAEYFIKPPVHVTISFPFNMELCKIDIDVSANLQNSSRLDIYTCATSNKDMTWNGVSTPSSPLADQTFSDNDVFTLVGKATLKNQNKVSFRHKAFKSRAPFHEFTEHSAVADGTFVQDLWNKGQFSLTNINHLRICISYVSGGSLPCLRRVDIWGQPSRSCPREVIESAFKVYQKYKAGQSVPLVTQKNVSVTQSNETQRDSLQPDVNGSSVAHGNVPEEFLDPITSEIMVLPTLLPCGKVIDQSTLDKYNQCEATWGRLPNDPFTNVPFSRNSKPIPHSTLKARLDYFLLHTTIPDRAVVGRTHVGFVASSAVKRKSDSPQGVITNPTSEGLNVGISGNSAAVLDCGEKRFKTETKKMQEPAQDLGAVSHEQRLSQSLDSALTSALSTLPSFTVQQRQDQQQPAVGSISACTQEWIPASSDEACISCKKSFSAYSQNMVVYRLLCGHLICRVCLSERQKSSAPSCLKCNRAICTSDVVRVHL
ncbi:RING finger protein 37 isoform X2 [Rhincodon typus]|uniref:RING finger protein 37 isoform X2 n=1 Tax=Rhincodon typus TaxID=259920 RepID=UPI0009A400C8|nr:RING finger protein 37 isoform X2 [Rhincodon typus]